jgi:hypothetical protein
VKVTALGGIPLKHQTGPLCGFDTSYDVYLAVVKVASVTIYGSQCPIAKGPADIKYDVKIASILPPVLGNSAFHLTAKNQQGTDIVCVQAKLEIVLEDRDDTATDSSVISKVARAEVDTPVAQVAAGLKVTGSKCIGDGDLCYTPYKCHQKCCLCQSQSGICDYMEGPGPQVWSCGAYMHSENVNGSPVPLVV